MTSYGATVSTKRGCLVCITLIAHLEIIAETVQGGPSFFRMLLVFQGVKFETGNVRYMMARQIFSQLFCIIYKRTPCITYQISNTARTTRIGYTAKYQKILALFYKELKFIII